MPAPMLAYFSSILPPCQTLAGAPKLTGALYSRLHIRHSFAAIYFTLHYRRVSLIIV
jgi:hypothetical protein